MLDTQMRFRLLSMLFKIFIWVGLGFLWANHQHNFVAHVLASHARIFRHYVMWLKDHPLVSGFCYLFQFLCPEYFMFCLLYSNICMYIYKWKLPLTYRRYVTYFNICIPFSVYDDSNSFTLITIISDNYLLQTSPSIYFLLNST